MESKINYSRLYLSTGSFHTPKILRLGILRPYFYHTFRIESINNGALQEIIFDWCVNSGYWGSSGVQKVLNRFFDCDLKMDGIIGNQTIAAINSCAPEQLFDAIKAARIHYYHVIARKDENAKFLDEWLRRINYFEFAT